ncbi:MAG: hypothetical protein ABII71_04645 [Candidatus Micrarchaeota archaeon]
MGGTQIISSPQAAKPEGPIKRRDRPSVIAGPRSGVVRIFAIGCDRELDKKLRGVDDERYVCSSYDRAENAAVQIANAEEAVVILGPEAYDIFNPGEMIGRVKGGKDIPVHVVIGDDAPSKLAGREVSIDEALTEGYLGPFDTIDAAGGIGVFRSEIMDAKPDELCARMESRSKLPNPPSGELLSREEHPDGLIVNFVDGKLKVVSEEQLNQIANAMALFAYRFDEHQRITGHYKSIFNVALELMLRYPGSVRRIMDVGCGSCPVLKLFMEDVGFPSFLADMKKNGKCEPNELFGVDMTPFLLVRGRKRLGTYKDEMSRKLADMGAEFAGRTISPEEVMLHTLFQADFLALEMGDALGDPTGNGRDGQLDMATMIYFLNWVADPEAAIRKVASALKGPDPKGNHGGVLIVLDETPMKVSHSPFMTAEVAQEVKRALRPLDWKVRDEMCADHGLVPEGEVVLNPIDKFTRNGNGNIILNPDFHSVGGQAYRKRRKD